MTASSQKLPPEICAENEQSFAAYTLRQRLPHIIEQIIASHSYSNHVIYALNALGDEIGSGTIQPLSQTDYVDSEIWHRCIQPHVGKSWFTAPFFFVEMYFYRRLGEVIGSLDVTDKANNDPFRWQKRKAFDTSFAKAQGLATCLATKYGDFGWVASSTELQQILLANLWSNCADLSQLPTGKSVKQPDDSNQLLIDDSEAIASFFSHQSQPLNRVDIILDNVGIELISDLALADFLITARLAQQVVLHGKHQPVFVSDVMRHDIWFTIQSFMVSEFEILRTWGERLESHLRNGAIAIQDHYFWTLPLDFSAIVPDLLADLSNTDLLISKGDANYRRLVGDRQWNLDTPISQIVDYFSFPCVALRVLKSEVLVGVNCDRLQELDLEQDWMINGTHGIIQFVPPQKLTLTHS